MEKRKIIKKLLNGEVVDIYDSITKACESVGATTCSNVCSAAKNKTAAYNYKWDYAD